MNRARFHRFFLVTSIYFSRIPTQPIQQNKVLEGRFLSGIHLDLAASNYVWSDSRFSIQPLREHNQSPTLLERLLLYSTQQLAVYTNKCRKKMTYDARSRGGDNLLTKGRKMREQNESIAIGTPERLLRAKTAFSMHHAVHNI